MTPEENDADIESVDQTEKDEPRSPLTRALVQTKADRRDSARPPPDRTDDRAKDEPDLAPPL